MNFRWIVVAVLCLPILGIVAVDPAVARVKQKTVSRCVDLPASFSWNIFATHPEPQPNGCAPPVYAYGKYVGQDPDRNIRFQLLRDPATSYSAHNNNWRVVMRIVSLRMVLSDPASPAEAGFAKAGNRFP